LSRIKRYRTALARHHRSGGFGIHSPSAYNFVRQVLRQRLPYYAYEDIAQYRSAVKSILTRADRHMMPLITTGEAKLLFRLVNHFMPEQILVVGTSHGVDCAAMLAVSSRSRLWLYEPRLEQMPHVVSVLRDDLARIECYDSLPVALSEFSASGDSVLLLVTDVPQPQDSETLGQAMRTVAMQGGVVVARNLHRNDALSRLWEQMCEELSYGHMFTNGKTAILFANKKLPYQRFSLWF